MNRKIAIYGVTLLALLTLFFFSFATYMFDLQEEMQLFIPSLNNSISLLQKPGGCCTLLGMLCTQYYNTPLFAALVNGLLLTSIGLTTLLLIKQITSSSTAFLLSLFPILFLQKFHIQLLYPTDGTIALVGIMAILLLITSKKTSRLKHIYGLLSNLVVYLIAGQLVALYTILLITFEFASGRRSSKPWAIYLITSSLLCILSIYQLQSLPLFDGLMGMTHHEVQLQPDSLIYYVWLQFSLLIIILILIARLAHWVNSKTRWTKALFTTLIASTAILFTLLNLPKKSDVMDRMIYQLSFLARRERWDEIVGIHLGKRVPTITNSNFLNMALAQKGALAHRLFYFDQNGVQSLVGPSNNYISKVLLSDIHFLIGDIGMAESYAIDALALARRGGSPRMYQRLIQTNLIRGEENLVAKYISLLEKMPSYREWCKHPKRELEELRQNIHKRKTISSNHNNLLSMLTLEDMWKEHLGNPNNKTAFEYLGCFYLLSKEGEKFRYLLQNSATLPSYNPLPLHFQEAALLLCSDDAEMIGSSMIEKSTRQKYADYLRQAKSVNSADLYEQYGNTFWFYYQYKNIKQ